MKYSVEDASQKGSDMFGLKIEIRRPSRFGYEKTDVKQSAEDR